MATKYTDNPAAWTAVNQAAEKADTPAAFAGTFETAAFETRTSRIDGADVTLRRVHLVGGWEVAPKN